jgi:hypothetical protein
MNSNNKEEIQRYLLENALIRTEETATQKYKVCLLIYIVTVQMSVLLLQRAMSLGDWHTVF